MGAGHPASIADASRHLLCGGERWGGDEKSHAPPFFLYGGTDHSAILPSQQDKALGSVLECGEITVAVSADDMEADNEKNPERHPVAIAL